ncbi:MAG: IMP dehydrogenase [Erysipelotrichales bacterium]|nr:IMP dehydrogenase [Erysipelotrichales bacterium]
MILKETKYSYNDLTIVPAVISKIKSRKEVNPFHNDMLPLFTAPMSAVINDENWVNYEMNKINPIIPRTVNIEKRIEFLKEDKWVAFSLFEAKEFFINSTSGCKKFKICIDIANGHMSDLISTCKIIKTHYPDCEIMTGNIANPATIREYMKADIDYVRVGIGGGSGCLTASNVNTYYPMASLIDECYKIRGRNCKPYIVADGGIRNYSHIICALALGADYVMVGSVFASLFESAAAVKNYGFNLIPWDPTISEENKIQLIKNHEKHDNPIEREFYGMSTKQAQKEMGSTACKTSEGCYKTLITTHTMKQWSENCESYLRSAMSYTDKKSLDDFIGNVDLVINSSATQNSVNK